MVKKKISLNIDSYMLDRLNMDLDFHKNTGMNENANNLTLSDTINRIFNQYLWTKPYGFQVPDELYVMILNTLSDKQISEIAKQYADKVRAEHTAILQCEGCSLFDLLEGFKHWIVGEHAGTAGYCGCLDGNGFWEINVEHENGRKWALFMTELFKEIFKITGRHVRTKVSEDRLFLKLYPL